MRAARLLPWSGPEGKASYLITDERGGRLSRLADVTETTQLDMGVQLLAHAEDLLPDATEVQLRFLAERLTEALRDILRVAESRGSGIREPGAEGREPGADGQGPGAEGRDPGAESREPGP
ncbi:hypothetical protein ACFY9S_05630 [Streptomyces sp. NPDC012474]|uniref:hypothetical protein n=1 Tax=Streptomyces sp. NPDC012474 TaxID=3364836 RepID=UPI0036EEC4DC